MNEKQVSVYEEKCTCVLGMCLSDDDWLGLKACEQCHLVSHRTKWRNFSIYAG